MHRRPVKLRASNIVSLCERLRDTLLNGGIVALPTDTIYGIATLLPYVEKIYDVKGRRLEKPVALCVSAIQHISKWAKVTVPELLLRDLLPGPVTVIFERTVDLPDYVNPNIDKVGIRIPDHSFIRNLVDSLGDQPIALTSANISDRPSCISVEEFEQLWPKIDVVVDDGPTADVTRSGSTVVDLSVVGHFEIIRNGNACDRTRRLLTSNNYGLIEIVNK